MDNIFHIYTTIEIQFGVIFQKIRDKGLILIFLSRYVVESTGNLSDERIEKD